MIRVAIADDHPIVRQGLRRIASDGAGISVAGEAASAVELFRLLAGAPVDVVLLDVSMPGSTFVETVRDLREKFPSVRVLVLSVHPEDQWALRALRAGASGYLLKEAAVEELPLALKAVMRGESYLTPKVSQAVVQGFLREGDLSAPDPLEGLTGRQREIMQLVAEGKSTKEIAAALDLSVKTVETHRARLMERLGIHDLPSLIRLAMRAGLIPPAE